MTTTALHRAEMSDERLSIPPALSSVRERERAGKSERDRAETQRIRAVVALLLGGPRAL